MGYMKALTTILCCTSLMLAGCGGEANDARNAVRATLKDPGSAKFGDFSLVGEKGACLTVNAKNSLGGYSGNQEAYLLKTKENGWMVLGIFEYGIKSCRDVLPLLIENLAKQGRPLP